MSPAPASADEQRGDKRVTINKAFDSLDAFVSEYVANVSRTGVFIARRNPLPIGTVVNLSFSVLIEGMHVIEGIGEVVRVEEDPPGNGLVFRELTSASEVIISRLLTAPRPKPATGD